MEQGVSPHTRGWTQTLEASLEDEKGKPAHAGVDRPCRRPRCVGQW